MAARREALDRLIEVVDCITSDLVVGERATEPGKYVVGALQLIKWRDHIAAALRILDRADYARGAGSVEVAPGALAVLRELEWIGMNDGRGVTYLQCPACSALKSRGTGHNPYCGLEAALSITSRSLQEQEKTDDTRVDKWDGRVG